MTISLKADASGTFGTLQVGGVDKLIVGPTTVAPAAGVTMVGNGPAFRAYQSGAQVITSTPSKVLFQTESFDACLYLTP